MKIEKQNDTLFCTVEHNLTIDTEYKFKSQLLEQVSDDIKIIHLDLSQVTFIDSTALGTLVFLTNNLNAKNIQLILKSITEPVRDIIEVGSFDLILKIQ